MRPLSSFSSSICALLVILAFFFFSASLGIHSRISTSSISTSTMASSITVSWWELSVACSWWLGLSVSTSVSWLGLGVAAVSRSPGGGLISLRLGLGLGFNGLGRRDGNLTAFSALSNQPLWLLGVWLGWSRDGLPCGTTTEMAVLLLVSLSRDCWRPSSFQGQGVEGNEEIYVCNDEDRWGIWGYVVQGLAEADRALDSNEAEVDKPTESGWPQLERSSSSTPFRVTSSWRVSLRAVSLRTFGGRSTAEVMEILGKVMARAQMMLM